MSKEITIADDVYEALDREKGDRSFSEAISVLLTTTANLADVTGKGILDGDAVEGTVESLSRGTLSRLEDNSR